MNTRAQNLKLFGRKFAIHGMFARQVEILGVGLPLAGIVIVVGLTLIALTVWTIIFSRAPRHITQNLTHQYAVADESFLRSMGVLLGPPLLPGNRVETLVNGDEIFPAMLAAIRAAKKTIT